MLDIAPNPYAEPIKKFIHDLKVTEWKFPFILQTFHALISILLLILLFILYSTIGIISQISNSFWALINGLGEKMSFSKPIESSFYAISATVYFIIFLPFFIIQSPIWIFGWFSSKIGLKPFIIIIVCLFLTSYILLYQPKFPTETFDKIIDLHDSIKTEYFASDSLDTDKNDITNINLID